MKPGESCELKAFGKWEAIELSQALKMPRERLMRCPECWGRVRAHAAGKDGQVAHFEHYENNPGCSLGFNFNGTRRKHKKVLE
jgi:hypothetical protein